MTRRAIREPIHRVARPAFYPMNRALMTQDEVRRAVEETHRLLLPLHPDAPKNWDSLGALAAVLDRTTRDARIFDAGAETYSRLLPWLELYGYRDLTGGNLIFHPESPVKQGRITYEHCDVTRTHYAAASFDAVTCLSVLEHGVDCDAFFSEMARIVKPGGLIVISTDYFEQPVDTGGRQAYGAPVRVFDRRGLLRMFSIATAHGFQLTADVDLSTKDRVVTWSEFALSYTFIVFAMTRAACH